MTTWVDGTSGNRAASVLEARARRPGVVYAADFGVVSDGTTNNSTAMTNAIAAAHGASASRRSRIMLPDDTAGGLIGLSTPITVLNGVAIEGVGKRGSGFKALAGFPTNTPVVNLGDVATEPVGFDERLVNLQIDCNNIVNSTGIKCTNCNEGCGAFGVGIFNYGKYGIWADGGSSNSSFGCEDIELLGSVSLNSGLAGFFADGSAGENFVHGCTSTPRGTGDCFLIQNNSVWNLSDIHTEGGANGVHVVTGTVMIDNIVGNSSVTTLCRFDSGTRYNSIRNAYANGSTNMIIDDFFGYTLTAAVSPFIMQWVQDEFRIAGAQIRSGTGSPNSVKTGNVGDLFLRRDGGANTCLYIKETGNGTNTGWVAK